MTNEVIYVDESGRPFVKPAKPASDCTTEEFVGWMRAMYAYNDAITNEASRAFDDQFRKSLREIR